MFNLSDGRGVVIYSEASGSTSCVDTYTCYHCNNVRPIDVGRSASDMGGWCFQCAKAICSVCAGRGECTPFLKTVERMEAEAYRKSQNSKCL